MPEDPIMKILREARCGRCGGPGPLCDCWVIDLVDKEKLSFEINKNIDKVKEAD